MEDLPEDESKGTNTVQNVRLRTPVTPKQGTPSRVPQSVGRGTTVTGEATPAKSEGGPTIDEVEVPKAVKESSSIQRAKHIKRLYKDRIESKWKELLTRKDLEKGKAVARTPGLERFEAG